MAQIKRKGSYPVLKIPLDMDSPIDSEVYRIFKGIGNGVEAKNFILSSVLYYSRSPLVLSANALTEAVRASSAKWDAAMQKLNEAIGGLASSGLVYKEAGEKPSPHEGASLDAKAKSELGSLRDKFKI